MRKSKNASEDSKNDKRRDIIGEAHRIMLGPSISSYLIQPEPRELSAEELEKVEEITERLDKILQEIREQLANESKEN